MSRTDFFKYDYFSKIDLNDIFFDSLKKDYQEFEDWFLRKQDHKAYYFETNEGIQAFLYLKIEEDAINDVVPSLPAKRRVKIGTLKINPHGTKFGDRFIKKAIDFAILNSANELYVTVFEKHVPLVNLLKKYGFQIIGTKTTHNGTELVLLKDISKENFDLNADIRHSYPLISKTKNTFLLGIYPEFHSRLFPDSILNTEIPYDVISDVSHSNSIEKVYICRMKGALEIQPKDQIVIYRTKEDGKTAEYSAVASTICTVVDIKTKRDFANAQAALDYCLGYSIFSEKEILQEYHSNSPMIIIKMLYSYSLPKRIIRKRLIEECGIDRNAYWGIINLSEHQFVNILTLGEVNEGIIVD